MTEFLQTPQGRRIAYNRSEGSGPWIVFLGGFKSDMQGTKAVHLEEWAKSQGRAYLRLDYSGHGESDGRFEDGCIGDWAEDALTAVTELTDGSVVLVGSSMGGWISLLVGEAIGARLAGLVTIAAAPDFTEDGFWASFSADEREQVMSEGFIDVPSDYDEPFRITRKLIVDGRDHLVLRNPLRLNVPVRMMQGTKDTAVTTETALKLLDHLQSDDSRLSLVRDADHRFSEPENLDQIITSIDEVITRAKS